MTKEYPSSFGEAGRLLDGEGEITIGHKTVLIARTPGYAIKYHKTIVVEFYRHCVCIFNGGFQTKTTKKRINDAIRPNFNVYSSKKTWYVEAKRNSIFSFSNGNSKKV
jgi:hypothetical protein